MEHFSNFSPLQIKRMHYQPPLPTQLQKLRQLFPTFEETNQNELNPKIAELFPHLAELKPVKFTLNSHTPAHTPKRVGVVFSGGQAPGGHNVISGLYDALVALHPESKLFGFLGGPSGLINNDHIILTRDVIQPYRNQGGFDMIGSGRTKLETEEQFSAVAKTADALQLNGIVIIGGDDSNTNAALLAEYLKAKGQNIAVVGVPKTIDGDLKNASIEISFGFDTACKTFSDIIGNIARDALSAKKYYHFIKLMGRSASHVTLECALQTHPNYAVIGEEVLAKKKTLRQITNEIADVIAKRAEDGKNYGVVILPEGVIEFIPEFKALISELNSALAHTDPEQAVSSLTDLSKECFNSLPELIQKQLLMDRDPHGNVQVSKIETERLFIAAVQEELDRRKKEGRYRGKFSAQPHFLGYEGRSCFPSNFDCQYCYALGHTAALLVFANASGYICSIRGLHGPVEDWQCGGVPLVRMMVLEERHGKQKPVIEKALVDLRDHRFREFVENRDEWATQDLYRYPGPIQFE